MKEEGRSCSAGGEHGRDFSSTVQNMGDCAVLWGSTGQIAQRWGTAWKNLCGKVGKPGGIAMQGEGSTG